MLMGQDRAIGHLAQRQIVHRVQQAAGRGRQQFRDVPGAGNCRVVGERLKSTQSGRSGYRAPACAPALGGFALRDAARSPRRRLRPDPDRAGLGEAGTVGGDADDVLGGAVWLPLRRHLDP